MQIDLFCSDAASTYSTLYEFGIAQYNNPPGNDWILATLSDLTSGHIRIDFHLQYMSIGFPVIATWSSSNCCFVLGDYMLKIGDSNPYPKAVGASSNHCNGPAYTAGVFYRFDGHPASITGSMSAGSACTFNNNPGIFYRRK